MEKTEALRLIKQFLRVVKQKKFFILLTLLLLFLPAENLYEKIRLQTLEPLVEEREIIPPQLAFYPVNQTGQAAPFLTAKSVVVIDVPSKVVLLNKNSDLRLPPASITKVMTALISLDNYQLDQILVVPKLDDLIGQNMGLFAGEQVSTEDLLYGLLVQSANDAALTLVANYPQGKEEFIALMNKKARELGFSNTHFVNSSGVDNPDHYSTSYDLAHLAAYAIRNPVFAKIVTTPKTTVYDVNKTYLHVLQSTNELIGQVPGLKGVKTGWTEAAGECLIAYTERENKKIITVLLGSQDRFGETKRLIDWVFANHAWQEVTLSTPS